MGKSLVNVKKLNDFVSVKDFGAVGDGITDDTSAIQAAIDSDRSVYLPKSSSFYKTTAPLNVYSHSTIVFEDEETEIRLVSGTGFVMQCDGGVSEGSAFKHIKISGGVLSGSGNASCLGGLKIKGAYLVHIDHMHCRLFSNASAIALLLENVFNTNVTNSRFNCGSSSGDIAGDIGVKLTITSGATWNITQVLFSNNLMQFNTRYGVAVTREGSTGAIDGVVIEGNGIGHNSTSGIVINTDEVEAVSIYSNHIEGDQDFGINITQPAVTASISANKIQDADVAVFHNGNGYIGENYITKASRTGSSSIYGVQVGASANVKIGENRIDSSWVTDNAKRYTVSSGGRADFGIIQTTTSNFGTIYSPNASNYNGAIVRTTDATDYSQRFFIAYGSSWYRLIPQFSSVVTISGTAPNIGGGGRVFKTNNGGATTMSSMPGGYTGQEVVVIFGDNNTTVDFTGTTLKGNSGVDFVAKTNDSMRCVFDGTNWSCSVAIS